MIAKLLVCTFIGGPLMIFDKGLDMVYVQYRGQAPVVVPAVNYPGEHRVDFDDGQRSYVISHGAISVQEGQANATFMLSCEEKSLEAITKKLMEEY